MIKTIKYFKHEVMVLEPHHQLPKDKKFIARGRFRLESYGESEEEAEMWLARKAKKVGANTLIDFEIEESYKGSEVFLRATPALTVDADDSSDHKELLENFRERRHSFVYKIFDHEVAYLFWLLFGILIAEAFHLFF